MSSWQPYVDKNLVGSGFIGKAAIFGLDGSKWAITAGFNVEPAEVKAIIAGFKDPNSIRASGIKAAGAKYFTLRSDDRSIYGKLVPIS
jgi:profilin